jgi:Transposase
MTKTIIAGLDVGKNSSYIVAWDADIPLSNPKEFFEYEAEFTCLSPNVESVNKIIALKPINGRLIVFMEPTGSYSRVWVSNLKDAGVEVHLVPHNLVNSSRLALCNWNDKDDEHDAVVLLVLAQKWWNNPNSVQLIKQKDPLIQELSNLYLDGESCNKVLNQLVNRARQKLHQEFPEVADINSIPTAKGEASRFWSWICGAVVPLRSEIKYRKQLANSIGSAKTKGFSKQLIAYAQSIVEWQLRRYQIDSKMRAILALPQFKRYVRIFRQFGAGTDTQAIWLIQIFPFEQFLGTDNQPIIRIKKRGTKSGKPTKAHISCRKFHSAMGMAPNQRNSGNKKGEFISGSGACRMALWRLVHSQIETNSPSSLRNKFGKRLRKFLEIDKNHRDELMHGLLTVLADRTSGAQTLVAIKAVLAAAPNPMAQTIAAGLDKKVEAARSGSIKEQVKFALIRLARSRCAAQLVKLLFKVLVQEFCKGDSPSADENVVNEGVAVWLTGAKLARRLGRSAAWLSQLKRRLGDGLADAIAQYDPDGYRWKWHQRKFYYSIPPGASDDNGSKALSVYD